MDEVKNLLVSPGFWLASVVLAFLMSFFANYAKDWTDKWFVRRSKKNDADAERRQANFAAKVSKVKANPYLLSLYQSNIVYQKLRQVLYLVVSYVFMALGLYGATTHNVLGALVMIIFAIGIMGIQIRSISRVLYELRAVINAAMEDDETHFVG